MTSETKTGLNAAVSDLVDVDQATPDCMPGEQASLFPLALAGESADVTYRRGAGRPPGAKNKNTEAWREFILARYPSPLQGLAEIMSRNVCDLAAELGYLKKDERGRVVRRPLPDELRELLKIQIAAMKELAPYVHSKQPIAVEAGEHGLISLVINAGGESQQKQEVSFADILEFNDDEFNELSERGAQSVIESKKHTDYKSDDREGFDGD